MKIIVLDGYTLNPGDLSWSGLEGLGELETFDRTTEDEVVERAAGAEILLTNKTKLSSDHINSLPQLKYIGVLATGYNVVDIKAARSKGVVVTNVPAYGTPFVAQHTIALILELCNRVGDHAASVRKGDWGRSVDFSYWNFPLIELSGKTLGIVGLGRIGQSVAKIALSFGMNVIAHHKHPERDKMDGVEFVSIDTLATLSDIVSLHCPLTEENKGFINREFISKMKSSSFLINTSRGPLVNERDLADALNEGIIAGAALDVLSEEPPPQYNPLIAAKNCIVTPHQAWASKEARERLLKIAVSNVKSFIAGTPANVIN